MRLLSIYHDAVPDFIEEIARAPEMRRLKQIGMNCGVEYTRFEGYRTCLPYDRYAHSLGVALIVWHFTGDARQAVAGLLHDISTPVFAHTVDFLRGDYLRQEATEARTAEMIDASAAIRKALKRYGLTAEEVSDYHVYSVADNDTPRLSADRLEYTLGNFLCFGTWNETRIRACYAALRLGVNEEGCPELMFTDEGEAVAFAQGALVNSRRFVHDEDRFAMQRLADILRLALSASVLSEADLYTTEPQVIEKLCGDDRMCAAWKAYTSLSKLRIRDRAPNEPGWLQVDAKRRWIDPYVWGRGRVTSLSSQIREEMKEFLSQPFDIWMKGEN